MNDQMTVHDENSRYPQCIWLIGGRECGNCIHSYNITNNRLIIIKYHHLKKFKKILNHQISYQYHV